MYAKICIRCSFITFWQNIDLNPSLDGLKFESEINHMNRGSMRVRCHLTRSPPKVEAGGGDP